MFPHSLPAAVVVILTLMTSSCVRAPMSKVTLREHRNETSLPEEPPNEARAMIEPTALRTPEHALTVTPKEEAYVLTEVSLRQADTALRRANESVSEALSSFEARACEGLTPAQRASGPLIAWSIDRVIPGRDGLLLHFKPEVDVTQVYHQLRCHLAYAAATDFERTSCPLLMKGLMISRDGSQGIVFLGESEAVASQLQAAARALFVGNPALTRLEH